TRTKTRRKPEVTPQPETNHCHQHPSTEAPTRQFSSEPNKTSEMLQLTVVIFPTRPSAVTTGISISMPSLLPRLIVTVRHQVEESRATISAAINLNTERCR